MQPYGLKSTCGKDWAEVFVSPDTKTLEVRTSPAWRVSSHRYCHNFALSEKMAQAWRGATIRIGQRGTIAEGIHEEMAKLSYADGWFVAYDSNSVRIKSPRALSDSKIKEVYLIVILQLRRKLELTAA